ncbi:natural killer cell receptor 2B4-like isoform X4 [Myxocyprinus asiaticus]|uniref:natural killer cell receptor 2B4-like isoform X4 n=1 Tax=Myxocyprinus asiaticus TaxID=70543 RepID=UPI0022231A7E|nr:natural killer cell receptor 2B4-like isoform X4 [Myxocyprinus asiaticus]
MIAKLVFLCLWLVFGVFGVDTDVLKSVLVMEGDSVTLHTDLTEIKRNEQILWAFRIKSSDTRIAEIYKQNIDMHQSNETFGDRLQLDRQTGSLTIRNIRFKHSGIYKLTIYSIEITYKHFNVTVYALLPIPVISSDSSQNSSLPKSSSSKCVLVCSVVNVTQVTLSWYKGNSLFSSISVSDLNSSLSLPLEVEYQENNIYSCVVSNPIRNQTKHLNITEVCQKCSEDREHSPVIVGICVALLILIVAAVVGGIYFHHKKKTRKEVQTHEEEVLYADTTFCERGIRSTKAIEENHTVYSVVVLRDQCY